MICNIRGIDNFYIIILIFIEKHQNDLGVIFLRGSVSNKDIWYFSL